MLGLAATKNFCFLNNELKQQFFQTHSTNNVDFELIKCNVATLTSSRDSDVHHIMLNQFKIAQTSNQFDILRNCTVNVPKIFKRAAKHFFYGGSLTTCFCFQRKLRSFSDSFREKRACVTDYLKDMWCMHAKKFLLKIACVHRTSLFNKIRPYY